MGIGNGSCQPSSSAAPRVSLPLMGIGSPSTSQIRRTRRSSLPLMGIGNPTDLQGLPTFWTLITPHGDWKRTLIFFIASRTSTSLPLMGIGNSPVRRVRAFMSWASLPLMGIGNVVDARHRHGLLHLITPHGDWKRRAPAAGRVGAAGLITPHGDWKPADAGLSLEGYVSSLPLMGIGNGPCRCSPA